jgi:hypothetical protein
LGLVARELDTLQPVVAVLVVIASGLTELIPSREVVGVADKMLTTPYLPVGQEQVEMSTFRGVHEQQM